MVIVNNQILFSCDIDRSIGSTEGVYRYTDLILILIFCLRVCCVRCVCVWAVSKSWNPPRVDNVWSRVGTVQFLAVLFHGFLRTEIGVVDVIIYAYE
jgi:hypothetical protein